MTTHRAFTASFDVTIALAALATIGVAACSSSPGDGVSTGESSSAVTGACDTHGAAALAWERAHLRDGSGSGCWSDMCGLFVYDAASQGAGFVPAWLNEPAATANDMMIHAQQAGVFHGWDGSCPCGAILFYEAHASITTGHVVLCNGDGTASSSGWPGWPGVGACGFDGNTSVSIDWLTAAEGIQPTGYVFYGGAPSTKPPPHPPAPTVCGAMKPGQGLEAGHSLSSCNGRFTLAMQGDGNLVLYLDGTHALWASNTAGRGGVVVVMQTDGNLVVYDADDRPVWADGKAGNAAASLAMQDDGNVVEYSTASKVLWATGTNVPVLPKPSGCGAMTAGQALQQSESLGSCDGTHMLVMQTDGNLVLYHSGKALWESNTAGTTAYTAEMQGDGNFVLYDAEHAPLWASRTPGSGGAHLAMQDDGNLVVYASGGKALWASGTNGK
jgi:hypothetical protein